MLINAHELQSLLDNPQLRIMDCRFALDNPSYGIQAYQSGHIPGAQYAHLDRDLSGPVVPGQTGRHPLPDAAKFLEKVRQWGIDQTTPVALYDDGSGAFASRLWWLLHWVGLHDVRLLNGGLKSWVAEGGQLETVEPRFQPTNYDSQPDSNRLVSAKQILHDLAEGDFTLIDARGGPRFRGEIEPIDPVAGHIPGARCYPHEENLDSSGCFKTPEELKARFAPLQGLNLVSYCGSGVTGCHNVFAMQLAGMAPPRLYAGSWSEWITDPSRPIAQGEE